MLITISGVIGEKIGASLVLETGGLGYQVHVTRADFEDQAVGAEVKLYLYEIIREDTHELYGFSDLAARRLFEQLLGVSGVGPKAALAILSNASVEGARSAIASGNAAILQAAPGIGKRTAERIIVELKNKVGGPAAGPAIQIDDAVHEALISLGYSASVAAQALAKVPAGVKGDEARIKQALKELS